MGLNSPIRRRFCLHKMQTPRRDQRSVLNMTVQRMSRTIFLYNANISKGDRFPLMPLFEPRIQIVHNYTFVSIYGAKRGRLYSSKNPVRTTAGLAGTSHRHPLWIGKYKIPVILVSYSTADKRRAEPQFVEIKLNFKRPL